MVRKAAPRLSLRDIIGRTMASQFRFARRFGVPYDSDFNRVGALVAFVLAYVDFYAEGDRNMAVYVVTGGAGFIGSNIVEELVRQGAQVRVIDNFATGKPENLKAFRDRIDFREIDICDLNALKEGVRGVDYVLHQAAIPSVPKSVIDP